MRGSEAMISDVVTGWLELNGGSVVEVGGERLKMTNRGFWVF